MNESSEKTPIITNITFSTYAKILSVVTAFVLECLCPLSNVWCAAESVKSNKVQHRVCKDSPGLFISPGHEWGSITCPFLSTTDSAADKQQALLFQTLAPPLWDGNTNFLWENPQTEIKTDYFTVILYDLLLCLCIQSCHHQWWYPRSQAEEPEGEQMQHKPI